MRDIQPTLMDRKHSTNRRLLLWMVAAGFAVAVSGGGPVVAKAHPGQQPAVQPQAAPANPAASPQPDDQRLLELANELKTEMHNTTKDQLSVAVMRRAEAIEKLAHQMRMH